MINLPRCHTTKYTYNAKNSVKAEKQTYEHPGCDGSIALDISSIFYEAKTSELKKLIPGTDITFKLEQDISYRVPNYVNKEDDDVDTVISGEAGGCISEMIGFNKELSDDEYQEVEIILSQGYGENL